MKTLVVILYGVTFITTVSSLICETCTAVNAATCSGSKNECDPSVTSCMSSMHQISYKTMNVKMHRKSCGFPEICNLSYSFTLNDVQIASEGKCCNSENCNKNFPQGRTGRLYTKKSDPVYRSRSHVHQIFRLLKLWRNMENPFLSRLCHSKCLCPIIARSRE
ncbi:unnamed protein product [Ranitomeya imitator]|uniref:UPAR/Ly6 domain-containing protein n=1 Tax=Ranitomeya imitator TaxID=111125 RepID=A0ABN9L4E3_9NEOB|nr:unnamed protein product [Ranitomeya imitator]